jgi:hypothetical protein
VQLGLQMVRLWEKKMILHMGARGHACVQACAHVFVCVHVRLLHICTRVGLCVGMFASVDFMHMLPTMRCCTARTSVR